MANYSRHIFIVIIFFIYNQGWVTGVIRCIINCCLNKNARKKRRKGQTIKERFFYTRYQDIIPKILIIWYYANMIYSLILLFSIIVMVLVDFGHEKTMNFCLMMNGIASIPSVIAFFMTKSYRSLDERDDVSHLVTRKKRNKK